MDLSAQAMAHDLSVEAYCSKLEVSGEVEAVAMPPEALERLSEVEAHPRVPGSMAARIPKDPDDVYTEPLEEIKAISTAHDYMPITKPYLIDFFMEDGAFVSRKTAACLTQWGEAALGQAERHGLIVSDGRGVKSLAPAIIADFQKGKIFATVREGVCVDRLTRMVSTHNGMALTKNQIKVAEQIIFKHYSQQNILDKVASIQIRKEGPYEIKHRSPAEMKMFSAEHWL